MSLPALLGRSYRWSSGDAALAVAWQNAPGIPELGIVAAGDLFDGDDRLTMKFVGAGDNPSWDATGGRLLFDLCAARASDGTYLHCESGSSVSRIMLYDVRTGAMTDLTTDNVSEGQPDWIPGTDEYVFASGRNAGSEDRFASLVHRRLLDPPEALVRIYTPARGNIITPRVSPGGDRVAFSKMARWSPDGSLLAVQQGRSLLVMDSSDGAPIETMDIGFFAFDWCTRTCGR
jgi:Tol biopolymer transport system component